jgi:hypothetical protein
MSVAVIDTPVPVVVVTLSASVVTLPAACDRLAARTVELNVTSLAEAIENASSCV